MLSLLTTSLLLASPALGQELVPTAAPAQPADSSNGLAAAPAIPAGVMESLGRSLLIDDVGDGTIWAAGPRWKASFGADGFTYIPFLGSDAPRNFPVHLALESVTVGGAPLAFDRTTVATRSGESSVTLDRSGVREVYHLDEASVEQTFVFDELPRSGEIVLRMRVDTELEAYADGAGVAFGSERGGVRYGAATGIAASGARIPLQERLVDGALEIRVPAGELGAEAFPFVVDPILTTFSVTSDAREQVDVDVAFDGATGVYMIVYEEVQSLADRDVRSVYYNTNVDLLLNPASIDISSENWTGPRVANSAEDSRFLCVATRGSIVGSRDVWGRIRDASNGFTGTAFAVSTFPGDNSAPDVGGFGGSFDTAFPFFVVWENYLSIADDYDVYGQAVGVSGTLEGPLRAIADSPTDDDRRPRMSASSGRSEMSSGRQDYLVAWERVVSANNRDLWTRVVDYTGSTTGHDEWLSYSLGETRNVAVSSQTRSFPGFADEAIYLIVFERLRNGFFELFTVVTREGNPDNARSVTEMQDIALDRHHTDPRIAQDGTGDYMIAYKSQVPGGWDAHVPVVNIVRDGSELRTAVAERRSPLVHATGGAGALAIASTYDGGLANLDSRSMVLFTATEPSGDEQVSGSLFEETSDQVDGSQFCEASDNSSGRSAWIRAGGSANFPGATLHIRVQDLPLHAFGYAIASLNTGFTANPGGSAGNLCLSGAIGRFNGQVVNSGGTGTVQVFLNLNSVPQPTGPVSVMAGERWKFQYWTRDTQAGMVTSNFSNAVVVDFF